jgi:hypothetical protein
MRIVLSAWNARIVLRPGGARKNRGTKKREEVREFVVKIMGTWGIYALEKPKKKDRYAIRLKMSDLDRAPVPVGS